MKKLYIIILAFAVLYFIYLNYTAENIIYMDQIRMTSLIEKYFSGDLKFTDLWSSYLGHRSLGYHLIFLLNVIFFNLNTLVEINLSGLCLLLISIIIIKSYNNSIKSINDIHKNKKIIILSLLTLLIVIYGLNKWETALLGLGLNEYIPHVMFLLMFFIFNDFLMENSISIKNKLILFGTLNLSIIFFSLAYLAPFFVSLYLVLIFDLFIKNKGKNIKTKLKIIFTYTINIVTLIIIYFYNINSNIESGTGLSIIDKVVSLFSQPLSVIKFFLYGISGSFIGAETAYRYIGNEYLLILGFIIFSLYLLAIFVFYKMKLYNISYFPILLILYSFGYMSLVMLGRIDYGILYGMQSRYALGMMYGLIGIIWVLTLSINIYYNKLLSIIYIIAILIILPCFVLTNIDEIKKSPYREAAYQKMRTDGYFLNMDNWQQYQSTQELTYAAFSTLQKYNLNVYYDYVNNEMKALGTNINQANIERGIYKEGDNKYWISKSASIQIKSGPTGKVILEGYMTDVFENNHIRISENGNEIYSEDLKQGQIKLLFNVEPNNIINMEFELEKTYIPSKLGLGNDERELGILVTQLIIE